MRMTDYKMLERMFFLGVLTPTIIVVILFIIFLICWFRCNLRQKIYEKFGRNSTTSSISGASGVQNAGRSRDYWEEETDAKNDSITISMQKNNNTTYKPGDFPLLTKQPDWRYMSSSSLAQTRDQILREKERENTKIWTTQSETLSVDSGASLEGAVDLQSNNSGSANINPSDIASVDVHRDSGFGSFAESGSELYNGSHLIWNQYNRDKYSPKRRMNLKEKYREPINNSQPPELYAELDSFSIANSSNVYPNQRLTLEGYNKRHSTSSGNDNPMIEMQNYYGQSTMPIAGIHTYGADARC